MTLQFDAGSQHYFVSSLGTIIDGDDAVLEDEQRDLGKINESGGCTLNQSNGEENCLESSHANGLARHKAGEQFPICIELV